MRAKRMVCLVLALAACAPPGQDNRAGGVPAETATRPVAEASPDATRLALVLNEPGSSRLMLFDARSGELSAQRALDFRASLLAYAGDGTALVIYGQPLGSTPGMTEPDAPRALLADAINLETLWDQPLTGILSGPWCLESCEAGFEEQLFADWTPAVVPSHDGQALYIVHADAERLTTVGTADIHAARSWMEELLALSAGVAQAKGAAEGAFKAAALSADGAKLYVVGSRMNSTRNEEGGWQFSEESLGLQVVDVKSGRQMAGQESQARGARITPDGAYVLLDGWDETGPWTQVLEAESLGELARLRGWEVLATRGLDGQPIMLGRKAGQLGVLEPPSFGVAHAWPAKTSAAWVGMP